MMPLDASARLQQLGIELPAKIAPAANYLPGVLRGDLLFVSGQTPRVGSAMTVEGKVGKDVDIEAARRGARICATRLLAVARDVLGSIDLVEGVVEITVYVHSTADFSQPSLVADAASDLMVEVFGEAGRHARTAVCVAQLPSNATVEISAVFLVDRRPHRANPSDGCGEVRFQDCSMRRSEGASCKSTCCDRVSASVRVAAEHASHLIGLQGKPRRRLGRLRPNRCPALASIDRSSRSLSGCALPISRPPPPSPQRARKRAARAPRRVVCTYGSKADAAGTRVDRPERSSFRSLDTKKRGRRRDAGTIAVLRADGCSNETTFRCIQDKVAGRARRSRADVIRRARPAYEPAAHRTARRACCRIAVLPRCG